MEKLLDDLYDIFDKNKIAVTGKQTDSTEQLYENRIVEKTMAVIAFSMGRTGEMIMTAIFASFDRKGNRLKEKKQKGREIWQKILTDSQRFKQSRVKSKVPDTAYVCPLLCTGVVCSNPVPMRNGISYRGSFHFHFYSLAPHHKTTVIHHLFISVSRRIRVVFLYTECGGR